MPPPKWLRWIPVLGVLLVFGRAVGYGFVEWDDARYLLGNPLVAGGAGEVPWLDSLLTPQMGYVVPVTIAVERALFVLGGGAAWTFHAAALGLHALNAYLVLRLVLRLGGGERAAILAALLWSCHPIVAEPVSWATGLKDVLALTLSLGCVLAYLGERFVVAVGLGVLAVLSKPTAGLVPLSLVAIEPRRLRPLGVLAGSSLVIAAASMLMRTVQIADRHGAAVSEGRANPLVVLATQAEHYVAPLALQPIYTVDNRSIWYSLVGLVVAAIAITAAWRGRGAVRFGALFAILAYLPSSQLVPFPRTLADSFLYAPTVGMCIIAARLPWPRPADVQRAAYLLIVLGALVATRQSTRWRSNETLWLPLIAEEPGWAYPCILLAQGYRQEGRSDAAAYLYEQAFARQYTPQYLSAFAEALYAAGRADDALCVLQEDLRFGPDAARALRNLERFAKLTGRPVDEGAAGRPPRQCAALARSIERIGAAQAGK